VETALAHFQLVPINTQFRQRRPWLR